MEMGESAGGPSSAPSSTTTVHAVLQLYTVTFSGNHPVEADTRGVHGPPEWSRGRYRQWPVCYTRAKNIGLTAKFLVAIPPTASETVSIRATFTAGSATLEWTGDVQCGPDDTEVTSAELQSSAPLPNEVACYDTAQIEFFASSTGNFESVGTAANVLYVLLGDPSGTPPYWTLLDISCRAAAGETSATGVVEKCFVPFTSRALTRMRDGQGLTYWNPTSTTCTSTSQLLASGDGSGQCGSWAEFLIDMHKVHGIGGSSKVLIIRTRADWLGSKSGFLVKNWVFVGPGTHAAPFTHVMYTECQKLPGIPGQRNPDPPEAFYNHFISRAFGKFYDPSYGAGPIADQTTWEAGAIDGLFAGNYCGFPKAQNLTTLLLEFH